MNTHRLLTAFSAVFALASPAQAAKVQQRYYAHPAVHDRYGVIAPWYTGQNGQLDFRVRIAAETLKRYPWTDPNTAVAAAPHFIFNGHWKITPDGTITAVPITNPDNGDLGQRAAYVLSGLVDYYRYSGDPAAIAIIHCQAEALLDHCLTSPDHPWPNFLISVPFKGKPYGKCDPKGMIQLDIVAEVGIGLLKSYQMTGNQRWLGACKHWGDLLAKHCNRQPGQPPWGRYANPETVPWKNNKQTGGVAFILYFLDDLIRLGHKGQNNELVQARDAGRAYLRDVLLPAWTVNDTWGRNYWDWEDPVQAENVTEFVCRYMMDNKDAFPNWRNDVRNILTLFFHRTSVCPKSAGEVYSGAWAFPESAGCCGRSLWYGPMELAVPIAQYAVETGSPWAREIARRMQILATYDGHETGVSEDNIDGGFVVNADWFKIAHPMALKHLLGTIAWMPEEFAPARENHIVRSTAVVTFVQYTLCGADPQQPRRDSDGRRRPQAEPAPPGADFADAGVFYATPHAPPGTITVLRLAARPRRIVDPDRHKEIPQRPNLRENGYTVRPLPGGDWLVEIRHDEMRFILIGMERSQATSASASHFTLTGKWTSPHGFPDPPNCQYADEAHAAAALKFRGNQIRLDGFTMPDGGLAEVYLDGVKQFVGIDCWQPPELGIFGSGGVLYYRNGLPDGEHTLKIVVLGKKNPLSKGNRVYIEEAEWSDAKGTPDAGEGRGPTDVQRMVFGYPGREDLKDSAGNLWRPATEWIVRTGTMTDSVAASWWTTPCADSIANTKDPQLYRYGAHAKEFIANVTVAPGSYYVRLKFAATRGIDTKKNCVSVEINGKRVATKMDVASAAGGPNKALDLVYSNIAPRNGVIDVRFLGGDPDKGIPGEAFVQALEVGPSNGGEEDHESTKTRKNEVGQRPEDAERSGVFGGVYLRPLDVPSFRAFVFS